MKRTTTTKRRSTKTQPVSAKRFDRFYRPGFASAPLALSNGYREGPPAEFTVVSIREPLAPGKQVLCERPKEAVAYWKAAVATSPWFKPEQEQLVVVMLNRRYKVIGHVTCVLGTLDTLWVHEREVFRAAIIVSAAAVLVMHNHPSGDSDPSESDVSVTKRLVVAGRLLHTEVLDHVIIGNGEWRSLKELGYIK